MLVFVFSATQYKRVALKGILLSQMGWLKICYMCNWIWTNRPNTEKVMGTRTNLQSFNSSFLIELTPYWINITGSYLFSSLSTKVYLGVKK